MLVMSSVERTIMILKTQPYITATQLKLTRDNFYNSLKEKQITIDSELLISLVKLNKYRCLATIASNPGRDEKESLYVSFCYSNKLGVEVVDRLFVRLTEYFLKEGQEQDLPYVFHEKSYIRLPLNLHPNSSLTDITFTYLSSTIRLRSGVYDSKYNLKLFNKAVKSL